MKKLLLFVFVIVPLLAVASAAAIVVTGIEKAPLVSEAASPDAQSLARGRDLVQRYRQSLLNPDSLTTLTADERDLNQMLAVAGRGLRHAAFDVRIRSTGMLAAASLRLPKTPLGEYLNARVGFVPSENGIAVDSARVGRIDIPGWLVLAGLRAGLDATLGGGRGDEALSSVRRVVFSPRNVVVTYRPTPELIAELEASAKQTYRDLAVDIDPALVRVYYAALVDKSRGPAAGRDASFSRYLGAAMALARQRSATGTAVDENRAAILALAIYFGDPRFERLIGAVRTGELAASPPDAGHVTLRGRRDLVQHFTVSAALAVTAGSGIADVIGEIKEVEDTGSGGSGFSFTDIAADRAGTRFALAATGSRSAARVQGLLAGAPPENLFFPAVDGLPEFMPAGEFARRFGNVGSAEYDRVVRDIDRRVAGLAVFDGN